MTAGTETMESQIVEKRLNNCSSLWHSFVVNEKILEYLIQYFVEIKAEKKNPKKTHLNINHLLSDQ
jgi:hypothetical protein